MKIYEEDGKLILEGEAKNIGRKGNKKDAETALLHEEKCLSIALDSNRKRLDALAVDKVNAKSEIGEKK